MSNVTGVHEIEYYYLMYTASSGNEYIRSGPFNTSAAVEDDRWNHHDEVFLYVGSMTKALAKEKYAYPTK